MEVLMDDYIYIIKLNGLIYKITNGDVQIAENVPKMCKICVSDNVNIPTKFRTKSVSKGTYMRLCLNLSLKKKRKKVFLNY